MTSTPRLMRPLLLGAVAIALASTGGCSWFKHKSNYSQSVENRPLEVPPDLDLPDTSAATTLPAVPGAARTLPAAPRVTATPPPAAPSVAVTPPVAPVETAALPAAASAATGVEVALADSATATFPRVGVILDGINGVVVNGRAEALASYDVTFRGENFLIRAMDSDSGSRLVALSPDGRALNSGPAVELMSIIKSEL